MTKQNKVTTPLIGTADIWLSYLFRMQRTAVCFLLKVTAQVISIRSHLGDYGFWQYVWKYLERQILSFDTSAIY